jgi:hypothetical protein
MVGPRTRGITSSGLAIQPAEGVGEGVAEGPAVREAVVAVLAFPCPGQGRYVCSRVLERVNDEFDRLRAWCTGARATKFQTRITEGLLDLATRDVWVGVDRYPGRHGGVRAWSSWRGSGRLGWHWRGHRPPLRTISGAVFYRVLRIGGIFESWTGIDSRCR